MRCYYCNYKFKQDDIYYDFDDCNICEDCVDEYFDNLKHERLREYDILGDLADSYYEEKMIERGE